jgi:hypothetical protein
MDISITRMSIFEKKRVRILLTCLGNMNDEDIKFYKSLVKEVEYIRLSEIETIGERKAFILLEFIDHLSISTDYVHGVLGIACSPLSNYEALDELDNVCKKVPNLFIRSCFMFKSDKNSGNIVSIPDYPIDQLRLNVRIKVKGLVIDLISRIAQVIREISVMSLETLKIKADLWMLIGFTREAIFGYKSILEQIKEDQTLKYIILDNIYTTELVLQLEEGCDQSTFWTKALEFKSRYEEILTQFENHGMYIECLKIISKIGEILRNTGYDKCLLVQMYFRLLIKTKEKNQAKGQFLLFRLAEEFKRLGNLKCLSFTLYKLAKDYVSSDQMNIIVSIYSQIQSSVSGWNKIHERIISKTIQNSLKHNSNVRDTMIYLNQYSDHLDEQQQTDLIQGLIESVKQLEVDMRKSRKRLYVCYLEERENISLMAQG